MRFHFQTLFLSPLISYLYGLLISCRKRLPCELKVSMKRLAVFHSKNTTKLWCRQEDLGHQLSANSSNYTSVNGTTTVCNYRTTDTGMGLSIIVAYMMPLYASVNATLSTGVTYIGYGGPLVYVINIIISAPGTYSVMSINPPCAGTWIPRVHCMLK